MATNRTAYGRKKYQVEFLLRTDDVKLVNRLRKLAKGKEHSLNSFIISEMRKVVENNKKDLVIS